MTAKKTIRPLKTPIKRAQPAIRRAAKTGTTPTTFERTTGPMPRLQLVVKAEPELDDEALEDSGVPELTEKDLILRLVEVLKRL